MGSDLVDKEGDDVPPCHGTEQYADVSGYIVVVLILRHQEVKPAEEADDKEQYERVGECEQEACHDVGPEGVLALLGAFERCRRVFLEKVYAEAYQREAADDLQ